MIRPCCLLAILAVGGTCILAPPWAASAPPNTLGEPGLALASKLEDASAPKSMGWEYSCPCQAGEGSWVNKYLAAEDDCGCNHPDWRCCSQPALYGYADYLNWAARRPGLDFAAVVPPPAHAGTPVPLLTDALDLGRNGDVRAGIGYRFAAGWDLAAATIRTSTPPTRRRLVKAPGGLGIAGHPQLVGHHPHEFGGGRRQPAPEHARPGGQLAFRAG